MTRVLLTGASGFVGSHVLRHLLVNTDWEIVCPITGQHRGDYARIAFAMAELPQDERPRAGRVRVFPHDLRVPWSYAQIRKLGDIDIIMNIASESHVDRSIHEPASFVRNNVDLML